MSNDVSGDKNFDDLAAKFSRKIYGSPKGRLRIHHLWRDLEDHISQIAPDKTIEIPTKSMKVLDVGCGVGNFSAKLVEQGHHVTLTDISATMLDQSKSFYADLTLDVNRVNWINCSWQNLKQSLADAAQPLEYDLVLFHAVLEWVAEPVEALNVLTSLIKPGGHCSLMFYNRNSIVMRNAVRGNFYKIMKGMFSGKYNSLTPDYPLDPQDVDQWIASLPVEVVTKTGIRVFYDYLPGAIAKQRSYEDVLALESEFCKREPFLSMGRYIHVLLRKNVESS